MKKSDYDFNKSLSVGHVIEAKPHRLNDTQKVIQVRVADLRHLGLALPI